MTNKTLWLNEFAVTAQSGFSLFQRGQLDNILELLKHVCMPLLGEKSPDMTAIYRDVRRAEWISVQAV